MMVPLLHTVCERMMPLLHTVCERMMPLLHTVCERTEVYLAALFSRAMRWRFHTTMPMVMSDSTPAPIYSNEATHL